MASTAALLSRLVDEYRFPADRAREAIHALGDAADLECAIGWLLDAGAEDRGGAVAPRHCAHADGSASELVPPSALRCDAPCARGCAGAENWVCLFCGLTHCSRYVNKHALVHWETTRAAAEEERAGAAEAGAAADGGRREALGHHLAVSLSDLSCWCYVCSGYINNAAVDAHLRQLRLLKFGAPTESAGAGASGSAAAPSEGGAGAPRSGKGKAPL